MISGKISVIEKLCLFCLYFTAACSYNDTLNQVSLYIMVPLATSLCFIKYNTKTISSYLKPLLCMFGWVAVSCLWAKHSDAAVRQMHQILGVVMLIYIYYSLARNKAVVPFLYCSFIICYIAAWHYAQTHILSVIDISSDRLNDDKLNANTLAYYTFYYTFATFLCHQIVNRKWGRRIFLILFLLSIPITVYTALLTASRQIFIIQIPLIGLCLMQKYFRFNAKSVILISIFAIIAFIGYEYVSDVLFEGSFLQQRYETDAKDDVRFILITDAFNVGISHFFTGVGAGNFLFYTPLRNFSHCTYLELFANTGILGLLFFIIPLYNYIRRQWFRYKHTKDLCFFSFLIFGIIFIIDNFFYVFYPDMFLMAFMCLVMSHSEQYWKTLYLSRIRK